jgi:hypothetical protein
MDKKDIKAVPQNNYVNPKIKMEILDEGAIKWNNLNFPPGLRLIHFDLKELKGLVKTVVLMLYIQFLVILGVEGLNSTIVTSYILNCSSGF